MDGTSTIDSTSEKGGAVISESSPRSPVPRIVFSSSLSEIVPGTEQSPLVTPNNHSSYDSLGYASNEENLPYFSYLRGKNCQQLRRGQKPSGDDDGSWTYHDPQRCVSGCFMVAILALSVLCCTMVLHYEHRDNDAHYQETDGLRTITEATTTAPTSAGFLLPYQNGETNNKEPHFDQLPYTMDSYSSFETTLSEIAEDSLAGLNAPIIIEDTSGESIPTLPDTDPPCKVTVVLVRHCNDYGLHATSYNPDDKQEPGYKHCSFLGYQQADFLNQHLFNGQHWPRPSALYALVPPMKPTAEKQERQRQSQNTNFRQVETLLPLAQENNLQIHIVASPRQAAKYVFDSLRQGTSTSSNHSSYDLCGKVSVIAWKHAFIPELAAYLGCSKCPHNWPSDDDFETVWMLQYVWNPPKPSREEDFVQHYQQYLVDNGSGFSGMILAKEQSQIQNSTSMNESGPSPRSNNTGQRRLFLRARFNGSHELSDKQNTKGNETKSRGQMKNLTHGLWTVYHQVTSQQFDPLLTSFPNEV